MPPTGGFLELYQYIYQERNFPEYHFNREASFYRKVKHSHKYLRKNFTVGVISL